MTTEQVLFIHIACWLFQRSVNTIFRPKFPTFQNRSSEDYGNSAQLWHYSNKTNVVLLLCGQIAKEEVITTHENLCLSDQYDEIERLKWSGETFDRRFDAVTNSCCSLSEDKTRSSPSADLLTIWRVQIPQIWHWPIRIHRACVKLIDEQFTDRCLGNLKVDKNPRNLCCCWKLFFEYAYLPVFS